MIISISEGGLGNQLFKYAFIQSIGRADESILLTGYDELERVFDIQRHSSISLRNRLVRIIVNRLLKPALNFFADIRLISSIKIDVEMVNGDYVRERDTFTKIQGLLGGVIYQRSGFFQSDSFIKPNFKTTVCIKPEFKQKADSFFSDSPSETYKVFVQVRRGDYADYKVYGKNTLLPTRFYKNQMDWFRERYQNCRFVILGDDAQWIKKEFGSMDDALLPDASEPGVDMAIMAKCNSAILSASSFGWWAAYMMEIRDVVIVPKYWLGFASACYYHARPVAGFMTEIEVCI